MAKKPRSSIQPVQPVRPVLSVESIRPVLPLETVTPIRSAKKLSANTAQLKVRLPESLRRRLEQAAANNNRSMNIEIVMRLVRSFQKDEDAAAVVAQTLLAGLDDAVIEEMLNILRNDEAAQMRADEAQERWDEMQGDKDRE